jgi:oxepin-CoA hydrolase/3-oxo-5,6-dehydrosuberyl-CoA semialdehyde dehydrogenase
MMYSPEAPSLTFIKEVRREMITKAGQKCTAIRRIIVPQQRIDEVSSALKEALEKVVVGDTKEKDVKMGSLVGRKQAEEVLSKVSPAQRCRPDRGMSEHVNLVGDNVSKEALCHLYY